MNLNLYSISSIFVATTCFSMTIFSLLRSKGREQDYVWILFCLMATVWGAGSWGFSTTNNYDLAYYYWKIANICTIFAPTFYTHFIFNLLGLRKRFFLFVLYVVSVFFIILVFFYPKIFLGDLTFTFNEFYIINWPTRKNVLYLLFYIVYYWGLLLYDWQLLVNNYRYETGIKREQIKYIILGSIFGWVGGHGIFPAVFGFNVYPFSNILIGVYPLVITYAIARYRLMDIRLAITNTGILLVIYTFVLGGPFYFYAVGYKLIALVVMFCLATAGPIIFNLLSRQAESRILEEQRKYQDTLLEASKQISKLRTKEEIVSRVVEIIYASMSLKNNAIYLKEEKFYRLIRKMGSSGQFIDKIFEDSPIVVILSNQGSFLVDEIKHKVKNGKQGFKETIFFFKEYTGSVVVPIIRDERMLGIIILGEKENNSFFSNSDLNVLNILSANTALNIENAQFYDDMKLTQEQLFQAEKMATIGIMADGLSHQINNRFHAMGFIAGDALDTIKMNKNLEMSDKLKQVMVELEKALNRVQDNVTQGGEVVQGLLKYTRKGEEGFSPVDVDTVVSSAYEMAQFKIKSYQMSLVRDYDKALIPKVKGNSTQLQEVFFNLIDNAYDAMMQRKNDLKEPDYKATLIIHAQQKDDHLEMIFEDNGAGVKEEDVQKLFTPFFTTKLSSKKGTGLGLYVIRKIIEDNHRGKVEFSSKFMIGTQMKIRLPIAV